MWMALLSNHSCTGLTIPSATPSKNETKRLRVKPKSGIFTDGEQSFLFHGINLVYKGAEALRITQKTVDYLLQHGFNSARLGFLWQDVQPTRNFFNTTYLQVIKEDIDLLWSNGIRVVLDLHQDCYSSYFCGTTDGVPDFIGQPPNATQFYQDGARAFPLPLVKPQYDPKIPATKENPWGRITNCPELGAKGGFGWASCYATFALGASVQQLYDNVDGRADEFADFWARIVKYFDQHPGIVGYEILNEPWLGDVPLTAKDFLITENPKHWNLWTQGVADAKNLQGLYDRVQAAIRKVDPQAIIFFEPATGGNFLDALPVGFTSGPGGAEYDQEGLNVLSYHIYCPWAERDMPVSNSTGSEIKRWIIQHSAEVCDPVNGVQFYTRRKDIDRLHVGGWLTEFGEVPQDSRAYPLLDHALTKMDETLQSWSYWGDMSYSDVAHGALVRPYPQSIWGTPLSLKYDNSTKVMTFEFQTPQDGSALMNTTFYLPPKEFGLAPAWAVDQRPFDAFKGYVQEKTNLYILEPIISDALYLQNFIITILPKYVPPS